MVFSWFWWDVFYGLGYEVDIFGVGVLDGLGKWVVGIDLV